jgi:SNF2 family DNA or RNA helicase
MISSLQHKHLRFTYKSEQAIDRVHRIGQRLPVHVTRLLIDNTVELKIIKLQEKKVTLLDCAIHKKKLKN